MRLAPSLLVNVLWLVGGLVAAGGAVAAGNGAASDAAKRPNNSFNLFVPAPPSASAAVLQAPGVGFTSSKGVITDPYKVPLIQNAGSLTPGR